MAFIFGLVLILLGIIGTQTLIEQKIPQTRQALDKLVEFKGIVGMVGIAIGIFWALDWLLHLNILIHFPLNLIISLISLLLCLGLGLIFGLDSIVNTQKEPYPPIIVRAQSVRARILPYQREMSIAAVVFGIIYWLLIL